MGQLLIRGGRIIDPGQGMDKIGDVLVEDGVVRGVAENIPQPEHAEVIDASGKVVCPGLIDLHCHLREPGFEDKETIATGTRAAAKGGFTTICAMPNTNPAMDSWAVVEYVLRKARDEGAVRVLPIGCVTKGGNGKELAEMGELADAGAIGFSDDGNPVADSNIMRQALSYSSAQGLPIINHCEDHALFEGGAMNEGWVSNRLGIKGIPNSSEDIMVSRDIALAELTGGRFHAAHLSTGASLGLIRQAKERGLNVTCEVTPHHLTLSDEAVLGLSGAEDTNHQSEKRFAPLTAGAYETRAKVNPPLRATADVEALVEGLKDGTIDAIATDHAPHNRVDKLCTFQEAAFGISVLETALGSLMGLVHAGRVELPLLIEKLTIGPARFLGRPDLGTLKEGAPADITIFDLDAEWIVDAESFVSKGKNTPLDGTTLKGRVVTTIFGGEVVYEAQE
ncbi:MAG: dihydroorotase [Chloroflexi bacterium]|nr:dihydroorotase [Chloroflexota bacterium]